MANWGGGGSLISYPVYPYPPASMKPYSVPLVAMNTNPTTGQQEIQDWGYSYTTIEVTMQPMDFQAGENWHYFLDLLRGPVNVFQFPTAVTTAFPYTLTSNGTTPQYFRLTNKPYDLEIKEGPIYYINFEIRQAT
jgi:hypothetical protein